MDEDAPGALQPARMPPDRLAHLNPQLRRVLAAMGEKEAGRLLRLLEADPERLLRLLAHDPERLVLLMRADPDMLLQMIDEYRSWKLLRGWSKWLAGAAFLAIAYAASLAHDLIGAVHDWLKLGK